MYFPAVYHMMETGWVKDSSTDVGVLHYQYQEEKLATPTAQTVDPQA